MNLGRAISAVGAGERSASFELFARDIDRAWIERALQATGSATVRMRKLPAHFVVWIVIAMALLRDRSIQEVVRHLDLVLPEAKTPKVRGLVSGSAVVQARDRLGAEPMAELFAQTAQHWCATSADQHRWRGLAVYGVDGSTLRVPDTKENEEAFGRPASGRGTAAYPQMRIVALVVLRSHLIANLALGACRESELTLAEPLLDALPDSSLAVVDRAYLSFYHLHRIQSQGTGRHWLTRLKKHVKIKTIRRLGPNDHLVELTATPQARQKHPELPKTLLARAVGYQRRGVAPQTLLTSLLDPVAYPAAEIVEMYHERWELETAFDEIKTHTLDREEALRSRAPARVRQEVWGLAIGYNLVRWEMERVANDTGIAPTQLSFRHSLMLIRNFWVTAWLASPGVLRKRLDSLQDDLVLLVLPQRRDRSYPRAVKIKMSGYPLKRKPRE
jgi:hypothetical protein